MVRSDVTSPDRVVTLIRRGSTLIGMIEQDAAAATRPDAVELVATGAGLIMETERLMAAARRDLEQSRLLAARLLSASDDPRAELRAQLLTGPLDDLACAAADLAAGASITEIAPRLATRVRGGAGHFPWRLPSLADHRWSSGRATGNRGTRPPLPRPRRDDRLPHLPGSIRPPSSLTRR